MPLKRKRKLTARSKSRFSKKRRITRSKSRTLKFRSRSRSRKGLKARGKSVLKVSGKIASTRRPRQPKSKFASSVLAVINQNLATHRYVNRQFSANISWAAGNANWIFTRTAADPQVLATYLPIPPVSGPELYNAKFLHVGSRKRDTVCNMGSLPMTCEVWSLVARHDLPAVMTATDAKSNGLLSAGQLVANDLVITGVTGSFIDVPMVPYDLPSLVKYFKIKCLAIRQIGGYKSLRIDSPMDYSFPTIDTRGAGPIGDPTYGGLWYMKRGQMILLLKVYGQLGPDDDNGPTLTENVTTGVFSNTYGKDANTAAHLGRSSGRCIIMAERWSDIKQMEDNTRQLTTTYTTYSASEPRQVRPLELAAHY